MRKHTKALAVVGLLIQIAFGRLQAGSLLVANNNSVGNLSVFCFLDNNMNGTYQPDGESFSDTNGNGCWDREDPFVDLNGNGVCDLGEYYYDTNGNGKWDKAESFVDADQDGQYDYADRPIPNWPFVLTGYSASGHWISIRAKTNADGMVIINNLPVSGSSGYTLKEDIGWSAVDIGSPTGPVKRVTYKVKEVKSPEGIVDIDRWQATTAVESVFALKSGENRRENFGVVYLSRVDGVNEVYDDGMPGQVAPSSCVGWRVSLAGKDHYGKDITIGSRQTMLPSKNLFWSETACGSDGSFSFVDLTPGRYYLDVPTNPNYRLAVDKPVCLGFDVYSKPWTCRLQNTRIGVSWKVFSAYPGNSKGIQHDKAGFSEGVDDLITAVPGILEIVPGANWDNFKQAAQVYQPSFPKNTVLVKEHLNLEQCQDVFAGAPVKQQGTPSIRLRWPLMYEPANTTWTLSVLYGTKIPVQLPGELKAGYVHEDVWKWVVDADIPHLKLLLDLFHEIPFGNAAVPIISDENLFSNLKAILDSVDVAQKDGDLPTAGTLLGQFEMDVMDACISTFPASPVSGGAGTGIAQTLENPACCKLLADAGYIGRKFGIFMQSK